MKVVEEVKDPKNEISASDAESKGYKNAKKDYENAKKDNEMLKSTNSKKYEENKKILSNLN